MESNKENVRRNIRTKIPLPKEPLPAIPRHLLTKNIEDSVNEKRHPLQTLLQTNVIPSSSKCNKENSLPKSKCKVKKIDTKHVTMRKNRDNLDWDYKVFKDPQQSVISISDEDDENQKSKEDTFFYENKQKNCLGVAITPPEKSPIKHKSIRNIKRSLKRPHSRELQGLSPAKEEEEKREEAKAKRRLEFDESLQERLLSPDFLRRSYMTCMNRDYTDYMLGYLLKVERKPQAAPTLSRITRACVINWLMKVNGPLGNPAIIQSACWYLDSVTGVSNVPLDKLQLVGAACFWIAQKLHGPLMPAARLVRCASHAFTQERLLAAEKAVLRELDFPAQPVVPNEFITYLAWWCDSAHPGEIEVAATFLCVSGLMVEKELCAEYPSVIACAAVKNAVLLLRKHDMIKHVQNCPMYKAAENKATSLSRTCAILRRAVRTIAEQSYEYKTPLEHYGVPPHYIAQQIVNAARR